MTKTRSEPAAPPERRLIDVRAVARLAGGVSAATVSRWAADDILPKPIKIGHLVRWWQHEVEAALAKMPRSDQPSAQPYILAERRGKARARAKAKRPEARS
jgi:predicted DNA-binding transcriptional regulator AlpA